MYHVYHRHLAYTEDVYEGLNQRQPLSRALAQSSKAAIDCAVATVPSRQYYSIKGYGMVMTATQPRMLSLTQKY